MSEELATPVPPVEEKNSGSNPVPSFSPFAISRLAAEANNVDSMDRPAIATEEQADKQELEDLLYARHVEVTTYNDLVQQRGTPIPALYNQFYRFIQNPSSVSVETFKRMVDTDDTIGSGVDFLTSCLAARIGRYQHASEEITDWVNKRLEEIDGGWVNVMKELLSASWAGFAVSEKVWGNTDNGFVPQKVVSLPPQTILFETHRTGELTDDGVLQYQRNYNPALYNSGSGYLFGFMGSSGGVDRYRPDMYAKLGDLPFPIRSANTYSYLSIRIPKMKCIHYAFDAQGKFGNPYGRSLLRRVYKYYVLKDATLQMLGVALDRKGTPLHLLYVDPNATFIDPAKWQPGTSNRDKNVGIRADQAVRDAFKNVHNDSTIIIPGKKGQFVEHDFVQQTSNASDFIAALDFYNRGIMRGLLLPSLVFTSGDGAGSFALGQEHAKTFDKICDSILSGFDQVLIHQLVKEMVAYNFPESAWKKDGLGTFGKRELSQEERDKEMSAVEKAVNLGGMDMSDLEDLNHLRDIVGAKPKTEVFPPPVMPGFGGEGGNEFDDGGEPTDKKPPAGKKNEPVPK